MIISSSPWLITSDIVEEVAFRIDTPDANRGQWVLSYLPTGCRLTRSQAVAGIALAEAILFGMDNPIASTSYDIAELHVQDLRISVQEAAYLLALRSAPENTADHRKNRTGSQSWISTRLSHAQHNL